MRNIGNASYNLHDISLSLLKIQIAHCINPDYAILEAWKTSPLFYVYNYITLYEVFRIKETFFL